MHIFAVNNASSPGYFSSMRLYSYKIYDNGALVRDFVPAKNSNDVIGLLDLVTQTFYTNAGSGSFTGA